MRFNPGCVCCEAEVTGCACCDPVPRTLYVNVTGGGGSNCYCIDQLGPFEVTYQGNFGGACIWSVVLEGTPLCVDNGGGHVCSLTVRVACSAAGAWSFGVDALAGPPGGCPDNITASCLGTTFDPVGQGDCDPVFVDFGTFTLCGCGFNATSVTVTE